MTETEGYGPLAAALSKAQAAFPAIPRDKEVTVQMKSGGSYKFKYAPLDTILTAVRKPLSENGLAIVQLLDDGELVTMLLHESGGVLSGRIAVSGATVQDLGSAITYLRRYSLQAILGIAAEEDDDGNRASGDVARSKPVPDPSRVDRETGEVKAEAQEHLLGDLPRPRAGVVERGESQYSDLQAHVTPDGHRIGFRLRAREGTIHQVIAEGDVAAALFAAASMDIDKLLSAHMTVDGRLYAIREKGRRELLRLRLSSFEVFDVKFPAGPHALPAPHDATETNEPSPEEQADLERVTDALWDDRQPEEGA